MLFQIAIMFLPWLIRRRLLAWKYGWEIHPTAIIGMAVILAKRLKMGEQSRIHNFVICRPIDDLIMCADSGIASFTYITGFPSGGQYFSHVENRRCELVLGRSAGITSRHFIDCNGGVYVGDFSTVAGIRTQLLTHSIDIYHNRQDAKPISIGRYCFIGTGCILLPGTAVPDYSILGAGSVLTKHYEDPGMLYAGNPAVGIKRLNIEEIPYFHRTKHKVD